MPPGKVEAERSGSDSQWERRCQRRTQSTSDCGGGGDGHAGLDGLAQEHLGERQRRVDYAGNAGAARCRPLRLRQGEVHPCGPSERSPEEGRRLPLWIHRVHQLYIGCVRQSSVQERPPHALPAAAVRPVSQGSRDRAAHVPQGGTPNAVITGVRRHDRKYSFSRLRLFF
jgi:hypothetical protein